MFSSVFKLFKGVGGIVSGIQKAAYYLRLAHKYSQYISAAADVAEFAIQRFGEIDKEVKTEIDKHKNTR